MTPWWLAEVRLEGSLLPQLLLVTSRESAEWLHRNATFLRWVTSSEDLDKLRKSVEFAGYMATAAINFVQTTCSVLDTFQAVVEGDSTMGDFYNQGDTMRESMKHLRASVYEFNKRAKR